MRLKLLASWIRCRRCWNERGLESAENDAVWVYEMREMLTDGEHFLDFINRRPGGMCLPLGVYSASVTSTDVCVSRGACGFR